MAWKVCGNVEETQIDPKSGVIILYSISTNCVCASCKLTGVDEAELKVWISWQVHLEYKNLGPLNFTWLEFARYKGDIFINQRKYALDSGLAKGDWVRLSKQQDAHSYTNLIAFLHLTSSRNHVKALKPNIQLQFLMIPRVLQTLEDHTPILYICYPKSQWLS